MKYVGSYTDYLELIEDARAYDDVVIAMQAEGEAETIRAAEAEQARRRSARG